MWKGASVLQYPRSQPWCFATWEVIIHHECCWGDSLTALRGQFVNLMCCRLLLPSCRWCWAVRLLHRALWGGWLMPGSGLGQFVQLLFSKLCYSLRVMAVSFPCGWAMRSSKWRCILMECLISRRFHIKINLSAQTHFLARSCGGCWFLVPPPCLPKE